MDPITTGTLPERRAAIESLLSAEDFGGHDPQAVMAEADEIAGGIEKHNADVTAAAERRARLASTGRPADTGAGDQPGRVTDTREGEGEREVRNGTTVARDFARAVQGFDTGKRTMDFEGMDTRSLLTTNGNTGTNSAGAFIPLVPQPGVIPVNPDRPLLLADLVNRQNTDTGIIEYVRDTTAKGAGNAAEVAEGGVKPETAYTFDLVSDTVKTVAHWTNVTRAVVADLSQLQAYIQSRLLYGLGFRLDNQMLNGDGTGVNLRGILNTSGILSYDPLHAGTPYTEKRVLSIRHAKTLIRKDEYVANTVALAPDDWDTIETTQDSQGRFMITPNVQENLTPRLWGLTVVETTALAMGTAVVGDFRLGATLWDRQMPTIYITDSHASNFTSNVLTILAELRVGLSIHRTYAFAQVLFNGTT